MAEMDCFSTLTHLLTFNNFPTENPVAQPPTPYSAFGNVWLGIVTLSTMASGKPLAL